MKPVLHAVAAFAVMGAIAAPAFAAPAPSWVVDKAASKIGFTSSMSGEAFSGGFKKWDSAIRFDPKNLAGSSVTTTIDMTSAVTGDEDRDESLPSAQWFSANTYAKATYTATKFKALGGNRYQADGTLTMRGVSKPVSLPFTLVITGDTAKMTSSINLNRLAFGVGTGEWASTTVVPANVRVDIVLVAKRGK